MYSGKLITTGLAVGAVIALILIPRTRKMISDAASRLTDSFSDIMDEANIVAEKGKNEFNSIAEKSKEIAGAAKAAKEAWQS